ncbi:MAG TPA: efflux RND transporter periplasmic adaptor subunit [Selenomonadales bacterium]|nr:efflux RND transporter periplasmic adaptor subunit [Selenomonadales bacterium]
MNLLRRWNDRPGKKLYYGLAAAAVVIGSIGVILGKWHGQPQEVAQAAPVVRTAVIGASGTAQGYTYSGEVRGRYESQLGFQVGGKIVKRYVELGSVVNAGDILMQIDAKDIQQTVNSSSAQVYSAESQLRLAESNLKRYRQLFEQGAISRAQYDQYLNMHEVAAAAVRQASAQYVQGANQLDYTLLRADKPGVVASIDAEMGQVVGAGQIVLTVVQAGEREVEISVPENRIEELRKAGPLKVTFWALPNVALEGKIREIAPMADKVTRTFKVRVSLVDPPEEIKLGMTASVALTGSHLGSAVSIPLAAVYQSGDQPAVWVVTGETLALRPITTGNFGNGSVEVLNGLEQGERIVTAGVHKLKEGQKVRVTGDSL